MFKKVISMAICAALTAAFIPNVFAEEEVSHSHVETMTVTKDGYAYYENNDGSVYSSSGTEEEIRAITKAQNNNISIGYLSFDLSQTKYKVDEESLDKIVLTTTVTTEAGGNLQMFYNDVYFDMDETNITKDAEMNYLLSINNASGQNRFWRAGRGTQIFHMGNASLKSTYRVDGVWQPMEIDITNAVKASLKAGKDKFTIMVRNSAGSGQMRIGSKENADASKRPTLTISTTEHVATVKTIAGSVTDDTIIQGSTTDTTVYGTATELLTKDTMRGAMIRFDVSAMADYNEYLKSVPITFWAKESNGSNVDIYLFENSSLEWSEDDFTRVSLLGEEAYKRENLNKIGGFSENDIGTVTINGKSYTKYVFDAKNYVQKLILDGKTSFTLLFYGSLNTNQITIASKENDDTSLRPSINAVVGVTKTLDTDWDIYANTDSVEIPEPAIAPGYVLNVKYKKADAEGGYTDMESFEKGDLVNGRFIVKGLDKDTDYEFVIVPEYDDEYDVFEPKTVSTVADTGFVMNTEITANDDGTKAIAKFNWIRGNSAADAIMLAIAAYTPDGILSDVSIENIDAVNVGSGSKSLTVNINGDETVRAFAWQQNLAPILAAE